MIVSTKRWVVPVHMFAWLDTQAGFRYEVVGPRRSAWPEGCGVEIRLLETHGEF